MTPRPRGASAETYNRRRATLAVAHTAWRGLPLARLRAVPVILEIRHTNSCSRAIFTPSRPALPAPSTDPLKSQRRCPAGGWLRHEPHCRRMPGKAGRYGEADHELGVLNVFSIRQLPVYLNWMMANIGGAGESRNRKGAVMVPDYYLSRSCGSMSLY
jgi:hypothetical protein